MKRLISCTLVLLMLIPVLTVSPVAFPAWNGDADGNGKIDLGDVISVLKYCAGWEISLDPLADFDLSGAVELSDAVSILKYLAGYNVAPDSLKEAAYGVSEVYFEVDEPVTDKTVYGSQFGFDTEADDNSQAFYDAVDYLKENSGTTLVIEKGLYRMNPPRMVVISGIKDCVIDGGGSVFLYKKNNYFTVTDSSERVMIKNLTVDWDWENSYTLTSMVRVRAVHDTDKVGFKRVEYEFFTTDDASYALTYPWENMLPYDPERLTIGVPGITDQMKPTEWNTELELVDSNVISALVPNSNVLKVGSVWMLRHYNYGANVFSTNGGAKHITYRDITIYSAHGCGFVMRGSGTGYIRLDGVTIGLNPENSDKYRISTVADAINMADTDGHLIIENCDIGYQGDDGVNIHDNVGMIEDINGAEILLKAANSDIFHVGATVRFKSSADFTDFDFTAKVIGRKAAGNAYFTLTLDSELPSEVDIGSITIDTSNDSSYYIIRNNYFHENRGRGLLLNNGNGIVENNRFYRTQAQGINITVEHWDHSWQEGTGVENLIIRNNVFDECNVEGREGCLTFIANSTYTSDGYLYGECFKNILISGNTFINTNKEAILARSATNLSIIGNTILNPDEIVSSYKEMTLGRRGKIKLSGSAFKNVKIENNTWDISPYTPDDVNEIDVASSFIGKKVFPFANIVK